MSNSNSNLSPKDPQRHINALKLYALAIVAILFVFFMINIIS